ncbi:MAG: substrate-binding periplasmic protein, partial [Janthinobacterium lividum]
VGGGRTGKDARRPFPARVAGDLVRVAVAGICLMSVLPSARAQDAQSPQPLRAALSRDVAPFEVSGLDGKPSGFSVDLFNAIALRLHRPVTFTVMERSAMLDAVADGGMDVAATPVTVSPELSTRFIFTSGYMWTEYQFGVLAGGAQITRLEDMTGHSLVVSDGTPYAAWARGNAARYGFSVQPVASNDLAVQAVLDGKADVVLAGNSTIRYLATQQSRFVPSLAITETRTAWAAPLRRTDLELRAAVDDALNCLKQDGTVAALSRKWFGTDPGPDDLERVVVPGHGVPGLAGYEPDARPPRC